MTTLIVLGLLFVLLAIGTPVGFAMAFSGSVGLLMVGGTGTLFGILETAPLSTVSSYELITIPMFLLMAELVLLSGVAGVRPGKVVILGAGIAGASACQAAVGLGARDLFIGVNAVDYSGYPDCRREFIRAFEALANLATKAGVEGRSFRIHAPLARLSKVEIVRTGLELGVDYSLTSSCYDPSPEGAACGLCDACLLRLAAFAEVETPDPIPYRAAELEAVV